MRTYGFGCGNFFVFENSLHHLRSTSAFVVVVIPIAFNSFTAWRQQSSTHLTQTWSFSNANWYARMINIALFLIVNMLNEVKLLQSTSSGSCTTFLNPSSLCTTNCNSSTRSATASAGHWQFWLCGEWYNRRCVPFLQMHKISLLQMLVFVAVFHLFPDRSNGLCVD